MLLFARKWVSIILVCQNLVYRVAQKLTFAVLFKLLEGYNEELLENWKQAVSKLVGVVPGRSAPDHSQRSTA